MANLGSAVLIIVQNARRKARLGKQRTYSNHLREQFQEYRHLIISPITLAFLSLPRMIISLVSDCVKVNHGSLIYLCGYLVSFSPAVVVFVIFVIPSPLYKEEFSKSCTMLKTRVSRMNIFTVKQ